MKTSEFDYELPEDLIAQTPAAVRDECRLLALDRTTGEIQDKIFKDVIDYLREGDLLVANETRVRPARLIGRKRGTGGACEVLLLRECAGPEARTNRVAYWEALVKPGKRLKPGSGAVVEFGSEDSPALSCEVVDWAKGEGANKGERVVRLSTTTDSLDDAFHEVGRTPLPPYIHDYTGDDEMYQTVYSAREGSAAAPTAGLHFTPELIERLSHRGVGFSTVELEVGLDTFRIVEEEDPADHAMHTELYTVSDRTAAAVEECRARGGRIVAVGTTSVRTLESAAARAKQQDPSRLILPAEREATSLFITPGFEFAAVDAMITNFHVPRSTLLMLVAAFSGYENMRQAYDHAISERYRMLSFGDAMLII